MRPSREPARKLGPKRLWTARSFQVAVCGRPEWLPAGRTKPLSDGRPRPAQSWPRLWHGLQSRGPSRLVGVDRVPRRRSSSFPFTVHSFLEFIPQAGVSVMVGLGSGAITPYRIHRLLALMRTSRVFSLEVSRHTKRADPLRWAASVESTSPCTFSTHETTHRLHEVRIVQKLLIVKS